MANRNCINKKFTHQLTEIIDANIQNERFGLSELAYELNMSRSNLDLRGSIVEETHCIKVIAIFPSIRVDQEHFYPVRQCSQLRHSHFGA